MLLLQVVTAAFDMRKHTLATIHFL